eukprot:5804688-Prymnesium_polylepis.1
MPLLTSSTSPPPCIAPPCVWAVSCSIAPLDTRAVAGRPCTPVQGASGQAAVGFAAPTSAAGQVRRTASRAVSVSIAPLDTCAVVGRPHAPICSSADRECSHASRAGAGGEWAGAVHFLCSRLRSGAGASRRPTGCYELSKHGGRHGGRGGRPPPLRVPALGAAAGSA